MKFVEPITDKKKIAAMKSVLKSGTYGPRNELLFSIGINTAYRISDLRQLKLSDVLHVFRGKVKVRDYLEMKEQKTKKNNSILIQKKLQRAILEYVDENFYEEIQNHDFDHYLFPSRLGEDQPLSRKRLWAIIHDAADAVGLKRVGPHSMRKTFGYFLYKNNTPMAIIQDLLNHSSEKETLRYIGITQEDKDTAVKSLDL